MNECARFATGDKKTQLVLSKLAVEDGLRSVHCRDGKGRLRSDTYTVYSRPDGAMVARPTLEIKRAGLTGCAIRIKWVGIGLLIILIARKSASGAHAYNLPT